jgi:hypothetical protein
MIKIFALSHFLDANRLSLRLKMLKQVDWISPPMLTAYARSLMAWPAHAREAERPWR